MIAIRSQGNLRFQTAPFTSTSHRPTRRTVAIQPSLSALVRMAWLSVLRQFGYRLLTAELDDAKKPVSGFTPASTCCRSEAARRTQQEPRPPFLRQYLSPAIQRGCCRPDFPMARESRLKHSLRHFLPSDSALKRCCCALARC